MIDESVSGWSWFVGKWAAFLTSMGVFELSISFGSRGFGS